MPLQLDTTPVVDRVTIAGLALLLMPLLTMVHEIGGHAGMCLALGHNPVELGAFYVECDTSSGSMDGRLVSGAGPAINILLSLLALQAWRRARGDLARLVLWYVWLCEGFAAAGYFAYSGLTGIGDLDPGSGGIGPLPGAAFFRVLFVAGGAFAYWRLILAGMRSLNQMIGQGPASKATRRTVAHQFYIVICVAAVLASLLNPVGLFITLASATAATFGGNAGLISIGFATREGSAKPFHIRRNWGMLAAGIIATLAFAIFLGPTITIR